MIWGALIPLFWTSGEVSSGFQSQNGQPYSHLAEAYSHLVKVMEEAKNVFDLCRQSK